MPWDVALTRMPAAATAEVDQLLVGWRGRKLKLEPTARWSSDGGQSFREIVRQQWHFRVFHLVRGIWGTQVELPSVTMLELNIIPDMSGGNAFASLAQLHLS
jgi:hypothetical protein